MKEAKYDIYRGTSLGNGVRTETVEGLQRAADRMSRLALAEPNDYFLYHDGKVIASVQNPIAHVSDVSHWRIILVSSDPEHLSTLSQILNNRGVEPVCVTSVSQYKEISTKYPTGLVFCDSNLSDGGYRDVVNAVRHLGSQAQVVITSGRDGWPEFIEAMRTGAFDIISKPCRAKDVEWMVIQAKRDTRRRAKTGTASHERSRARGDLSEAGEASGK